MCDLDESAHKGCCRWMLAAVFRSCFGTCFKKFAGPPGYDSLEDAPEDYKNGSRQSCDSLKGLTCDKGYATLDSPGFYTYRGGLDNRSKSTSEIFRSSDYHNYNEFMRPDKRAFSASFGFLDDDNIWDKGMRSTLTSTNDLRSNMSVVSDAFYSCKGSASRSSVCYTSDREFYSDESEDAKDQDSPEEGGSCEQCGESGKDHSFGDSDRCNWRDASLNSSLPVPHSQKWIRLD